jgi:DNA-binding cell septation regulator SpoVG
MGPRKAAGAKLISWRAYRNAAGTMLGFAAAQLSSGMIINDLQIMRGSKGALWAAMPSVKQVDRDGNPVLGPNGKPLWTDFVEFQDKETRERFSTMIVDLVRDAHPGDLDDEGAS